MVSLGDLVLARSAKNGSESSWGECVGKYKDAAGKRRYEVYFIREVTDDLFEYDVDFEDIEGTTVEARIRNDANYATAWASAGYLLFGSGQNVQLIPHDRLQVVTADTISDSEDEETDDDDTSDEDSLDGFIVADSDVEYEDDAFGPDTPDSEQLHRARAEADETFRQWTPRTPGERAFKETIDRLDTKYRHKASDDDVFGQ